MFVIVILFKLRPQKYVFVIPRARRLHGGVEENSNHASTQRFRTATDGLYLACRYLMYYLLVVYYYYLLLYVRSMFCNRIQRAYYDNNNVVYQYTSFLYSVMNARTIFVLSIDKGIRSSTGILQNIRVHGEKGRDNGRAIQRGFF